MDNNTQVLIGMAGMAVTALAAFAIYRQRQRQRVRRIESQVKEYLSGRYGGLPNPLSINCSDDPLWPVLVNFDFPHTGVHHRLQFACGGRRPTFSLLAANEVQG